MEPFHDTFNRWLAGFLGTQVIKAYQGGDLPPKPFIETNIARSGIVRGNPVNLWAAEVDEEGASRVLQEYEHRISVRAFGDDPEALLRPLVFARWHEQRVEPLLPFRIHTAGPGIDFIPELVENTWEQRAVVRVECRAIIRSTQPGDIAETHQGISTEDLT